MGLGRAHPGISPLFPGKVPEASSETSGQDGALGGFDSPLPTCGDEGTEVEDKVDLAYLGAHHEGTVFRIHQ